MQGKSADDDQIRSQCKIVLELLQLLASEPTVVKALGDYTASVSALSAHLSGEQTSQAAMAVLHAIALSDNVHVWSCNAEGDTTQMVCEVLSADSGLQSAALAILRQLAPHHSASQTIAVSSAVPSIIAALSGTAGESCQDDAFALLTLLSSEPTVATHLTENARAIEGLVARIQDGFDDQGAPTDSGESVIATLANLTLSCEALRHSVVSAGVLDPVVRALGSSPQIDDAVLRLLSNLLRHDQHAQLIVDAGGAPKVAAALSHPSAPIQALAVVAVSYLSVHSCAREALGSCGTIEGLLAVLSNPAAAASHFQAVWALHNLCLDHANHEMFYNSGGASALEQLLEAKIVLPGGEALPKMYSHCALFIASLSMNPQPDGLPAALCSDRLLQALKSLMQSSNEAVVTHATMALHNIAFDKQAVMKMKGMGVLSAAQSLKSSTNIVLSQTASRLFSTLGLA